jgi:hypothetical protein
MHIWSLCRPTLSFFGSKRRCQALIKRAQCSDVVHAWLTSLESCSRTLLELCQSFGCSTYVAVLSRSERSSTQTKIYWWRVFPGTRHAKVPISIFPPAALHEHPRSSDILFQFHLELCGANYTLKFHHMYIHGEHRNNGPQVAGPRGFTHRKPVTRIRGREGNYV